VKALVFPVNEPIVITEAG